MSGIGDLIPIRENGQGEEARVTASWWNDIRTALMLLFGSGSVLEDSFTIADNQSAYADITGLLFDSDTVKSAKVEYTIYRTDGAVERRETGYLTLHYKAIGAAWSYSRRSDHGDDALNVADSLFVTTAGQVQYKSDSMGGTYSGFIRYKSIVSFAS